MSLHNRSTIKHSSPLCTDSKRGIFGDRRPDSHLPSVSLVPPSSLPRVGEVFRNRLQLTERDGTSVAVLYDRGRGRWEGRKGLIPASP